MASFETEVLIIGGGWTGVSAAAELTKMGVSFRLLEADPSRLGGRAYSFAYNPDPEGPPLYWEHGAQYIGTSQTAIWELAQQHCPDQIMDGYALRQKYPQQIMVVNNVRYSYRRDACLFNIGGLPPGLGLFDLLATILMIDQIETIEQAIDVLEPWNSPAPLLALDTITLETWIDQRWMPPTARSLVAVSANAVLSVEPKQITPLYFFWYSACNDGFLQECNDEEGGPQQYYLKCGVDALVNAVAEPFKSQITFDAPVTSISIADDAVTVETASGDTWRAQQVVLAMSPHTAAKIAFDPPLPPAYEALTKLPMGRTVKCMVYYKSAWWRDSHGLQYTGYSGAANGGVTWVMDYSPDDGSDVWCLMTFTIGDEADNLGPHPTKEAVTDLVTRGMAFLFNDLRALVDGGEFVSLEHFTWNEETPFSGGGPNTVFGIHAITSPDAPAKVLNRALGERVWFSCAETARNPDARATSRYCDTTTDPPTYSDIRHSMGYMDGAIHEGRFVANQVAKALGLPYNTAIDNTFPSTAPTVSLPDKVSELTREQVRDVLKTLTGLLVAKSALQIPSPVDPMQLITQVGEAVGVALVLNLIKPNQADLMGFVGSGYKYLNSGDTDEVTKEIVYLVGVLNGLVAVLSAATTTSSEAASGDTPAPGRRLKGASVFAKAIRSKLS